MDPLNALATVFLGWIRARKWERYVKVTFSCLASAFVTFTGTMGLAIPGYYAAGQSPAWALVLAFGNGLVATAAVVLFLWRRSGLTKDIPIVTTGPVDNQLTTTLQNDTLVTSGERK